MVLYDWTAFWLFDKSSLKCREETALTTPILLLLVPTIELTLSIYSLQMIYINPLTPPPPYNILDLVIMGIWEIFNQIIQDGKQKHILFARLLDVVITILY